MRYLGRLDDVCSTMDAHKWTAIENILDIYQVKPMVGIVPANAVLIIVNIVGQHTER